VNIQLDLSTSTILTKKVHFYLQISTFTPQCPLFQLRKSSFLFQCPLFQLRKSSFPLQCPLFSITSSSFYMELQKNETKTFPCFEFICYYHFMISISLEFFKFISPFSITFYFFNNFMF